VIPTPRWSDIQGLVVSSYHHLDAAAYLLLKIEDPGAARAWLGRNVSRVTTAAEGSDADRRHALAAQGHVNLNVALSYSGLQKLHPICQAHSDGFQRSFVEGIDGSDHRSRILGDTGASAPLKWDWGGASKPIDVLLMLFGLNEAVVNTAAHSLESPGLTLVQRLNALSLRVARGREHFGFVDGISQPILKGTAAAERERDSQHLTELGEFVFGHIDEDKRRARGPALPGWPAFGMNGSHLVFRQLRQDVKAFWDFVYGATRSPAGAEDAVAAEALASKIVGRWRDGTPRVPYGVANDNEFDFTGDPYGYGCPIGSHVRRANPRGSVALARLPPDKANRHRLVRRSRPYGPRLEDADRRRDDGQERGLLFLVLNADFERQFEFISQNWVNNSGFAGVHDERDPLIGRRDGRGANFFSIPREPVRVRVGPLHEFVTVKGGEYFFLPGIAALTYLASRNGLAS
jgi:Dyp-type peroxidase family